MKRILFGVTIPMTANAFLRPQFEKLISEGWDVHVVCSDEDGIEKIKKIIGLQVHTISMRREPSTVRDIFALYQWFVLLKRLKPQIVIGSTPKAALLSMLSSKVLRIPFRIYHARGFRAESLNGVAKKISLIVETITIRLSSEVLCDSTSLRNSLMNHGCLPINSGVVLGKGSCCGVDTDFFRPPSTKEKSQARQVLGIKEDDFVVGFLGRITADKGIHELIMAGHELQNLDERIKIAIVGPCEKDVEISQHNLNHQAFYFFGPTADVRIFYWAFDIFVLPSYREGFPIAPLEAQSCGLPLVTTVATGCIDSQPPANSILSIPVKDHKALAESILFLSRNPDIRIHMGTIARNWVQANFDSKKIIELHNNFLTKLVG